MPPDYKKSQIYKLVNDELGLTYYGSTIQPLHKRLHGHKIKLNCSSKILFTEGKCKIYLVEEYPCDNKHQLLQQERYYIENNDCINKRIPCRTKEDLNKYYKKYRKENKDIIKQYREDNKEKYKKYQEENKDKYKQYQQEDKYKEYQKQYKKDNKEAIKKQQAEKLTCECGSIVSRHHISTHKKTKKHINYDVKNSF
tara:strand:- start:3208 stop:3798 length:591 start_codon:yes stop_codon:yes gene_type:complete